MLGFFAYFGFGVEGDAQARGGEHGQVVGAVAHGDRLAGVDAFFRGDLLEQLGFTRAVDDVAHHAAGELAVGHLQHVGVHVVQAQATLEVIAEVGKPARQHRGLVAKGPQVGHQRLSPFGEFKPVGHGLHHAFGQAGKRGHALAQAVVKVDLPTHRRLGDGGDLFAGAGFFGQLVDDLGLDQRAVHVEDHHAPAAAVSVVALPGQVQRVLGADVHKPRLHRRRVAGLATQPKLHAGPAGALRLVTRRASAEAVNHVDVQPLRGDLTGHRGELGGGHRAGKQGEDVPWLALLGAPVVVVGVGHRAGLEFQAQLRGRGFERGQRRFAWEAHHHAQQQ